MQRPAAIDKLAALLLEKESRATDGARLLHDEVGPTLSGVGFHLHALGVDREVLAPIREYLEQAMDGVRKASTRLQTNTAGRSGLPLALTLLCERLAAEFKIPIAVDGSTAKRLEPPVAHAVYRIVEMALDNALRHAEASAILVRLSGETIVVQDNGKGFDPAQIMLRPSGIGLILMESYAGSVNLQLRVDSAAGQGTIVLIQTI
jgi:signal transduction histidine kinase